MKTVAMPLLILAFFSASFGSWQILSRSNSFVVGGEYVVPRGQVLQGDLYAFFAQVFVEDGASVAGRLVGVSSTLDLAGSVGGRVLALSSDVTVRQSARLAANVGELSGVPYVVLLPRLALTGHASALIQ
jgi:hypothetical protein